MTDQNWLQELTGKPKPIIGMVHLPALPGTPLYDASGGMKAIRDWVARDLEALQEGGIHAVMFCNENDRPYRLDADMASATAMADVVATFRQRTLRAVWRQCPLGPESDARRGRGDRRELFAAKFSLERSRATLVCGSDQREMRFGIVARSARKTCV